MHTSDSYHQFNGTSLRMLDCLEIIKKCKLYFLLDIFTFFVFGFHFAWIFLGIFRRCVKLFSIFPFFVLFIYLYDIMLNNVVLTWWLTHWMLYLNMYLYSIILSIIQKYHSNSFHCSYFVLKLNTRNIDISLVITSIYPYNYRY